MSLENPPKYNIAIIGSGLAGLYAANYASQFGTVALFTKATMSLSNSYWAQGGIAAAIDRDDSPEYHMDDTLEAGRGLCNNEAVKVLVTEGVDRVKNLIDMGMKFDKENGGLALGLEGGHSKRRVLHAGGDITGSEVVNFLTDVVLKNDKINVYEHTQVSKLIVKNDKCCGFTAIDLETKKHLLVKANSVIIASGGGSGVYGRTTNPFTATGDGIVLAYDVGAVIADMEFIQFHPTSFYSTTGETFLISEAVRGEGAYLYNSEDKRFMLDISEFAELAPRDIVARSIFNEIINSDEDYVKLRLDHLDSEKIKKRFSNIFSEAKKRGIDITEDPIPVAPAAHYMIGGVKTNLNAETNIKNLYACGEVSATGVHGANRLASNSLLECLVFGKRAVDSAVNAEHGNGELCQVTLAEFDESYKNFFLTEKNKIADLMTKYVGVVRSKSFLNSMLTHLDDVTEEIDEINNYFTNNLLSIIKVCRLITLSALGREESRGVHYREDFPKKDNTKNYHIEIEKGALPKQILA